MLSARLQGVLSEAECACVPNENDNDIFTRRNQHHMITEGLVLVHLLCNRMYNALSKIKLPSGAEMSAFADVAGFFEDSYYTR